jgi:formylglycine-generating enzyme
MRNFSLSFLALLALALTVRSETPAGFVFVEGGTFKHSKSNYHGKAVTLSSFYVGQHEVTQKEWTEVMGTNPSEFKNEHGPVEMVSWYDCLEYCNQRSLNEGLKPYYTIDKTQKDPRNQNELDDVKWTVTINPGANGYRLPTEAEWEYAASGGQLSKNHTYCGSDDLDKVGWYWRNSGDEPLPGLWNWPLVKANNGKPKPVGGKEPNELGIYDMSGNVREWCWDWEGHIPSNVTDPKGSDRGNARVWKGGGWMGADFCCEPAFRAGYDPHNRGNDQGFRVCRGK